MGTETLRGAWVVYKVKSYSGVAADVIVSISETKPAIVPPGHVVRHWTRFTIQPWMRARGLVK